MTHIREFILDPNSPASDAFGRLRVSEPVTIFDSKLLGLDDAPLLWDEALESGGGITASTPGAGTPYIDFFSTLNTAGVFTRQTFRRFNYQPGKSQLVLMTGVLDMTGGGTGVQRRIGLFDDNNGIFFEDDAGTVGVTVRTNLSGSPADTTVTQANWDDPMDGTGASGVTVDWTTSQIFLFDFQWLAVGRIRFGLDIDGVFVPVHAPASHANTLATPWASTPNLPLRYQIITTSSSPASTMRVICSAVISEGGHDPLGAVHSEVMESHINANTVGTTYALIGLRLKSTHLGYTVDLADVNILSDSADNLIWKLLFNPTVAGTFAFADHANSAVQIAVGDVSGNPSTNTVTGGHLIASGFVVSRGSISSPLPMANGKMGAKIDGTRDTCVLCVAPLTANSNVHGGMNWRETG